MTNDQKATITGIVAAIPQVVPTICSLFSIAVPPVTILNALSGIGLAILGYFCNKPEDK